MTNLRDSLRTTGFGNDKPKGFPSETGGFLGNDTGGSFGNDKRKGFPSGVRTSRFPSGMTSKRNAKRRNAKTQADPGNRGDMEYRQLGQTSLQLSVLGFGASPLGDVFRKTEPAERNAAVHFAVDQGINFFDVSPYYGITLAETRLGEALEGRRDKVVLATKCGRYGGAEFDFSEHAIVAGFEESLKRLRTDHVDLLQAHDVEFGHVDQIVDETIPAMRMLQEQGKARYIGITGYSLKNLMAIADEAELDSILSYCRYNLLITDLDCELVPFARKNGIGVINASPLHMGIITERGAPEWHPAAQAVRDAGQRVVALCKARGLDASEVALKFCLEYGGAASTLVGLSCREHVERNLKAMELKLDAELLAEIAKVVAPVKDVTWASGLEENYG
jgi:L-galactose dehydrogenase